MLNFFHLCSLAKFGDYWRLLLEGDYDIQVSADGYQNSTKFVQVPAQVEIVNFVLRKNTGMFFGHIKAGNSYFIA